MMMNYTTKEITELNTHKNTCSCWEKEREFAARSGASLLVNRNSECCVAKYPKHSTLTLIYYSTPPPLSFLHFLTIRILVFLIMRFIPIISFSLRFYSQQQAIRKYWKVSDFRYLKSYKRIIPHFISQKIDHWMPSNRLACHKSNFLLQSMH